MMEKNQNFIISDKVEDALLHHKPIVALETTVITHGLPYPHNINLAERIENTITAEGVIPATIGVIDGKVRVGISQHDVQELATHPHTEKVSLRDFSKLIAQQGWGGTTVAGTMWVANQVGIPVFATGGIGGVHRSLKQGFSYDISTDLMALSDIPVIVVCSGAKSILNLEATLEVLETYAVPVIGYQTNAFPAFYAKDSGGLQTSCMAKNALEVAQIAKTHWDLGFRSGVLVAVPPPDEYALPFDEVEKYIQIALSEAEKLNIRGQAVTPFLLEKLNELSHGKSLDANLALLLNNAKIAAQIAKSISSISTY
ncbi:MAG: pseudouridine-5'-phosphate glycosidase [Candidatus Kryptoniota bacterium]